MKAFVLNRIRLAMVGLWWLSAQLLAAQDFQMTLQPADQTLIPGKSVSFLIFLDPVNGPVTNADLSVVALPSGVTATFSPNPVPLPGTSILSLTAATDATAGPFTLNVTAIGGGFTNTTSSSVTVNFGLLTNCYGAVTGTVTDVNTGLPIPGAEVAIPGTLMSTYSDAHGVYAFVDLFLGTDNAPYKYELVASSPGYWASSFSSGGFEAVCDATNEVNLQLLPQLYGSISGNVTIAGGGPVAGATVHLIGPIFAAATTDTNGNFQATGLGLEPGNFPAGYSVKVQPPGCWTATVDTTVYPNSNSVVKLVADPICFLSVTGSVVYADTELPATNAFVSVAGGSGAISVFTDDRGNYLATGLTLGPDNTPEGSPVGNVNVSASGYYQATTNVYLAACGETFSSGVIYLTPLPRNNYGSLIGHVLDLQTDLPVPNAYVYVEGAMFYTDTNGLFTATNVLLGSGSTTSLVVSLEGVGSGYFPASTNTTLYSGITATQDLQLLRMEYGAVEGTVREPATGLPLTNVQVNVSSGISVYTDSQGHYFEGSLLLNAGNQPKTATLTTYLSGYFSLPTPITIVAGVTNLVDLQMTRVCPGATIIGTVVDAGTQKPITNATVIAETALSSRSAMTDTNGSFILTNVPVGAFNSPSEIYLQANAPGYNPQSQFVSIFCNATIFTQFGALPTGFGAVHGQVTNAVTGLPLAGVFVGSEFGESTNTDASGFYSLTQAPLGANGSTRVWNITAAPTNYPAQTLPVTVSSNAISILNFGFDQPATQLEVAGTSAPDPVTVGSNLIYTLTLSNNAAGAAKVQLTDQLPAGVTFLSASVTNPPDGSFLAPVFSNSVVVTTATNLGSGESIVLVITAVPTAAGLVTNVVTVTSATPDVDPSGTNRTASIVTTVDAPIVTPLFATIQGDLTNTLTGLPLPNSTVTSQFGAVTTTDANGFYQFLGVALGTNNSSRAWNITASPAGFPAQTAAVTVSPNGVAILNFGFTPALTQLEVAGTSAPDPITVGSNLIYTLTLSNNAAGAADVQLTDQLPAGVTFLSASVTNPPDGSFLAPVFSNSVVVTTATNLGSGESIVLVITAVPTAAGLVTNIVTVTSATPDFDPSGTNRTASIVTTVNAPVVTPLFATIQGDLTNTLTGLPLANSTVTSQFGAATTTDANGFYQFSGVALGTNNSSRAWNITASPAGFPTQTAAVTVSANGVAILNFGFTPALTQLEVAGTSAPDPVTVGSNLIYTITLSNNAAGAANVQLTDQLPAGVTFLSASITNPPDGSFLAPVFSNSVVVTTATNLGSGESIALVITAVPTTAGFLTNVVTVTSATPDVDPSGTNRAASIVTTVNAPAITNNSTLTPGAIAFNPQTGLFEQTVQFNNLSGGSISAVRLSTGELPAGVALYNASGSIEGVPYVEHDQTVAASASINFVLEYYSGSRNPFVVTNFTATVVTPATPTVPVGTVIQLDRMPTLQNGHVLIEFSSTPGATYVIQYSSDMATWFTAVPSITAAGTRVQWIDSGPPKTISAPASTGQRFYRVVLTVAGPANQP